ncbi:MAG: response regulator [Candidatus Marinimicrobia bacterium]|nr:response regulator [Candidatus Neomarinimicrobiota bacterium]
MAGTRLKVLVVDDMRNMRLTLSGIIEDHGYDVTGVEDGYEAIDAAKETVFDLIFMDIKMPGINGVQTFREIKKISPESVVVMMTGFAVEDLVKEALEEGAFAAIYKPFDVDKVLTLVKSVLKTVLILVVDDRSSDREILSEILRDQGYRVVEVADGNEALQAVITRHYDIIFMDIKLPGKHGVAVFEEIKAIDPEVRAIFITGFVLEDSIKQALDAGAYPVAFKPFEVEKILALVKQMSAEKST